MKFVLYLPLVVLGLDLLLMRQFVGKVQKQVYFHLFDRTTWLLIVTIGNIFGQILYLYMENQSDF